MNTWQIMTDNKRVVVISFDMDARPDIEKYFSPWILTVSPQNFETYKYPIFYRLQA